MADTTLAHTALTDTALHAGFDRGNYAQAYEAGGFDRAERRAARSAAFIGYKGDALEAYLAGHILGWFSSHDIEEMGTHADAYMAALNGPWGKRAAAIGIAVPTEQDHTDAIRD